MKILVIDDDEAVRKSFQLSLHGEDHEIHTAEDGQHGVALATSLQPDLIFLDLKMPGMNGVETLEAIWATGCRARIIVVTAFQADFFKDLQRVYQEGIPFDLLRKPLGRADIIAAVNGTHDANLA